MTQDYDQCECPLCGEWAETDVDLGIHMLGAHPTIEYMTEHGEYYCFACDGRMPSYRATAAHWLEMHPSELAHHRALAHMRAMAR